MRLMITGAGGFLGSRLLSFYRETYEVWGVGRRELDFTDAAKTLEAVTRFCPDVLIHCGAVSDVGTCEKEPERSFLVNVTGSENLAKACAQAGAKMILCSSDQVYFGEEGAKEEDASSFLLPHREDEPLKPRPLYGRQKLLAEQLCLAALPSCVCLRLTWMYDVLTDGERKKGRKNLASMFLEAMEKETPLDFSAQDWRGVTDVNPVIAQMEKAWTLPGGVYNYGSSACGSIYGEMQRAAEALERRTGKRVSIGEAPKGNLRNLTMDTGKAERFGISFPATAEGLADFLQKVRRESI